jgi:carbonic anhydrase
MKRRTAAWHATGASCALLVFAGVKLVAHMTASPDPVTPRTPAEALAALKAGNERYIRDSRRFVHLGRRRIAETEAAQHPYATILSCSDSRAPVEHIFDAGIGDLFVVRVAGNVCSDHEEGSIEYAVDHLDTPLVVVLGHTRCGAVTAVVEHAKLEGHVPHLSEHILPAYERARAEVPAEDHDRVLDATIRHNVLIEMNDLLDASPEVREKVETGQVQVVGGVYDLKTGEVHWLADEPVSRPVSTPSSPGVGK